MDWIADPTVWVGLATLIALEIVLGVDNLIFIAILSEKLPPAQRNRARVIGLSLALIMRLGLLASISWVMSLTAPVFGFWRFEFSWRDLILIVGGLFLLVKATTEIHERIEGHAQPRYGKVAHAAFWPIVAQIILLDAVFSLDSIITAVGMVDELYVMMTAVIVAVLAMLVAAKPLTNFIVARPSLVILCLGFLLMIGLVLVVDGFGLHIPKGYVYAAIAFSVLIEILNQLAARGRRKHDGEAPPSRQRVAETVLKLMGGLPAFQPAEQRMVGEVLKLGERRVRDIMTPRERVAWIDSRWPADRILEFVRANPHREFPVAQGSLEHIAGVARKEEVLDRRALAAGMVKPPLEIRDDSTVLDAIALFKKHPAEMAMVVDFHGAFLGIATRADLLEAIAGELPDVP